MIAPPERARNARRERSCAPMPLSCRGVTSAGHRVRFFCNGQAVDLAVDPAESLLVVLRERLGLYSVKDGCAPQGQCGCCTVLVDGKARVACVTPVVRVAGRAVDTVEGLEPAESAALAAGFAAAGGSQCRVCPPGILARAARLRRNGPTARS